MKMGSDTQRNLAFIIFGVVGMLIIIFVVGAVPAKSSGQEKHVVMKSSKPVHVISVPSPEGFDYKFLSSLIIIFGSMIAFAFYNGGRLGKIENKIDNLQEAMNDARESRRELRTELNDARDRLTRVEERVGSSSSSSENTPKKINAPSFR